MCGRVPWLKTAKNRDIKVSLYGAVASAAVECNRDDEQQETEHQRDDVAEAGE